MKIIAFAIVLLCAAAPAAAPAHAQHAAHGNSAPASSLTPYSGQEARAITSLSAEEIDGYRTAKGMGLAKAAELNGFPGPMHVLELDKELALTDQQRSKIQSIMNAMKAKGRTLGEKYIAAEKAIDEAFRAHAKPDVVAKRVAIAAKLHADIRTAHLAAHLETTPLLSNVQRAKYAALRGYTSSSHDPSQHKN